MEYLNDFKKMCQVNSQNKLQMAFIDNIYFKTLISNAVFLPRFYCTMSFLVWPPLLSI